jgi:hypothetical protein
MSDEVRLPPALLLEAPAVAGCMLTYLQAHQELVDPLLDLFDILGVSSSSLCLLVIACLCLCGLPVCNWAFVYVKLSAARCNARQHAQPSRPMHSCLNARGALTMCYNKGSEG